MKRKLKIVFFLSIFIFIPFYFYFLQAVKPVNPYDKNYVTFSISLGEDVRTIAQRLEDEKLIRSGLVFFLKARFSDFGKKIQAGDFILGPEMDMSQIARELLHGKSDIRLTIPEGWRKEEVAMRIANNLGIPEIEVLKNTREGYLFPDTYSIPKEATGIAIIKIMEENFIKKTAKLQKETANNPKVSFDQAIIIASLIEREAKLAEDRPLIASVILNRLNLGMKLDIDATVQYALGYQPQEKNWWKRHLTGDDLTIESPFNTYVNPGLPPSPIANPGLSAIEAVYKAPLTDYLYYVADKTGKSHFARDFEEHAANISKYLDQ